MVTSTLARSSILHEISSFDCPTALTNRYAFKVNIFGTPMRLKWTNLVHCVSLQSNRDQEAVGE